MIEEFKHELGLQTRRFLVKRNGRSPNYRGQDADHISEGTEVVATGILIDRWWSELYIEGGEDGWNTVGFDFIKFLD